VSVFLALLIQHANHIFSAPFYSVMCCLFGCSYCIINSTLFGKKLLNIKCVFRFSLQLLFETFLTLRNIQRDNIINVHRSSCKIPVILAKLSWNLNFFWQAFKNPQISNFMKIHPVGIELFHAAGQTDMLKLSTDLHMHLKITCLLEHYM